MTKSKPTNWITVTRRIPSTGRTIEVSRQNGETHWDDIAVSFWEDTLSGLESVPSSVNASVKKGVVMPGGQICYFKRFFIRKWVDHVKQVFRPSRAKRALLRGSTLQEAGFRVPEAICLIEQRRFGCIGEGALINAAAVAANPLTSILRQPDLGIANNIQRKRRLLRQLGREIGKLHQLGFFHGDMNAGNILCERTDDVSFVWIDNERTTKFRNLPLKHRIHNLKQLNKIRQSVSRTDRMRVWKEYLSVAALAPTTAQDVVKRVLHATNRDWKRGWEI